MTIITQLAKNFLIPGSIPFLVFGLLGGLILLHMNEISRRWGRRWLIVLGGLYYFLSTPYIADMLAAGLYYGYSPVTEAAQVEGATGVVVLSGGSVTYRARGREIDDPSRPSTFRAIEAAYIHSLLDDPWVILSGGIGDPRHQLTPEVKAMAKVLIEIGVPADRFLLEPESQNTYEQAVNVAELLERYDIEKFVLVTSPTHMRRARAVFAALGLDPITAIAPVRSDGLPARSSPFMLSTGALLGSQSAMREYLATTYYWLRGWLG